MQTEVPINDDDDEIAYFNLGLWPNFGVTVTLSYTPKTEVRSDLRDQIECLLSLENRMQISS